MKHDEVDSSTSAHPELPAETSDQSVVDVDVVVAAAAADVAAPRVSEPVSPAPDSQPPAVRPSDSE